MSLDRSRRPSRASLCLLGMFLLAIALGAGESSAIPICGDNVCAGPPWETSATCPQDCGGFCGDGICSANETCGSCLADCGGGCPTFTISSELKKNSCTNDDDGDCLDNFRERELAFFFAPHYFYDEDEDCAGAFYTDNPNQQHFGRRDFYQVRPRGNPASWTTTGGIKDVAITYYLLHPHDCQSILGAGGHQGDSEHVVFHLRGVNLRTWTLTRADYFHHGRVHQFDGHYLKQRANEIGTVFPSIAADEDGHGSWPGRFGSSTHCAGTEDDFCTLGTCDCFRGTMAQAFSAGFREFLRTDRNIGGPPPERFRPNAVSVSGIFPNQEAFTVLDVGHGPQTEIWTPRTDGFKKFCGWECPQRTSSGNCAATTHGEWTCSSPLSEKIDTAGFTPISGSLTAGEPIAAIYDREENSRLAAEVHDLLNGLSHLTPAAIEQVQARLPEAADPVGEIAPLVADQPREMQLETLEWALASAPEKLPVALTPGLLPGDGLTPEEITDEAIELVKGLIGLLREAGYGRETK